MSPIVSGVILNRKRFLTTALFFVVALPSLTAQAATFQISAGSNCTLALEKDGTVLAWGWNKHGELGIGTNTDKNRPTAVAGLSDITAIAAGDNYNVALKSDGRVFAWGDNSYGQLGDGTTANRNSPAEVIGLSGVTAIAAGGGHTVALQSDGTVVAWGDNSYGQLGDGTTVMRSTPVIIPGLSEVTALAAGGGHTVALLKDGTLVAWGRNNHGQLGNGSMVQSFSPEPVTGLSGIIAITAGGGHSVALQKDGRVASWGDNYHGQLGIAAAQNSTPNLIQGLSDVTAIAAGTIHTVALKSDGTLVIWGGNAYGQLGNGTNVQSSTPATVTGVNNITAIAAGTAHTVALKNDGSLSTWGGNAYGQLGNGSNIDQTTPVAVSGFSVLTALRAPPQQVTSLPAPAETRQPATSLAQPSIPVVSPVRVKAAAGVCSGCTVQQNTNLVIASDGLEIIGNLDSNDLSIFKLSAPTRLVIDICCAASSTNGRDTTYDVNRMGISSVRVGSHPDKLRIVLQSPLGIFPAYRVSTTARGIKLLFGEGATVGTPAPTASSSQGSVTAQKPQAVQVMSAPASEAVEKAPPVVAQAAPPVAPILAETDGVQECKTCKAEKAATVYLVADGLDITSDLAIDAYNVFKLSNPTRLVIDICCANNGARGKTSTHDVNRMGISSVRIGNYPDKVRIVLQSPLSDFPAYRIKKTPGGVKLQLY